MGQCYTHPTKWRHTNKPGPSTAYPQGPSTRLHQGTKTIFHTEHNNTQNPIHPPQETIRTLPNSNYPQHPKPRLTHLGKHSSLLLNYPIHHLLYTFIVTYSPIPHICNQWLAGNLDPRCLTILRRIHNSPKYIHAKETHVTNHPTHTTQRITMAQAYAHINKKITQGEPTTTTILKRWLPHLPLNKIHELTKCTQTVRGYHPTTNMANTYHTPPVSIRTYTHQATSLKIITWNAGCISSSLPGIQELTQTLQADPHIILLQETKLQKLKFTSYIDCKLQNYKIITDTPDPPQLGEVS